MRLANKVAIVTGGAGAGIGQATARVLAREGASVVICDAHAKRVDSIAKDISNTLGVQTMGVQCDITDSAKVNDMVRLTIEKFGKIDILVNNVGLNKLVPVWEMSDDTWDFIIKVNLTGLFYCTRAVLPGMMDHKSGSIINLSSMAAYISTRDNGCAYAASKGGVISFTKTVATEVAPYNIRVNAVAPAIIWNDYFNKIPESRPGFYDEWRKKMPMGRFGMPEEVANAILFLASDEASYTSGTVISVTGGYHTW